MSFIDQRLPEKYAYGCVSGDEWQIEIVESLGRQEWRNSPAADPRRVWDLSTTPRNQADRDNIHKWFLAMRGQLHSFPFRDPADYICERNTFGTGDGAAVAFQLTKTYTVGSASYVRDLTKPITNTVRIWVDGVEQLAGWSVARLTGIVTFDAAPAADAVLECYTEFDVPVRFNQSRLHWTAENYSNGPMWACPELSLIEVLGE